MRKGALDFRFFITPLCTYRKGSRIKEDPRCGRQLIQGALEEYQSTEVHGTRWAASKSAKRAGCCHCEAAHYCLWKVMDIGEVFHDWKKADGTLIFRKGKKGSLGKYRTTMEWTILEVISRHRKRRWWFGTASMDFQGWIAPDQLIASCAEMTSSVGDRKAGNAVYLEFSKAFHVISHRILVCNFRWSSLDKHKNGWTIGQKGSCSVWRLVTVESLGSLSCLIPLSMTWRKREDAVLSGLWTDDSKQVV